MGKQEMGRGRRGEPPGINNTTTTANMTLPAEAFTACKGKRSGDEVSFSPENGKLVVATCQVIDDHLVAVPERRRTKS